MTSFEKSESLIRLAGGYDPLVDAIRTNLHEGNTQWALELSSACRIGFPKSDECLGLSVIALRCMAAKEPGATGRNWYLTTALELEGKVHLIVSDAQKRQTLSKFKTMREIFDFLPVRLRSEEALDLDHVVHWQFDDSKENVCAVFRRGVYYNTWPCERTPDVQVITTTTTLRNIFNKDVGITRAIARGDIEVRGSLLTLMKCLSKIEFDVH
eukprot:GHVQ01014175.1.p1 GENE.GHVQ01014175.1~~GHVQ01014175.1.p1  ORF type:complete len:212 (+),score=27.92 GHVQ01014175.1:63-698(+)